MLYTKYESSRPCSFRQEDFWKLHIENLFFYPMTYLCNFGRGPPRDHSCEVWSKCNEWFQRRRCLSKKVYARRTMTAHDARRTTTDDGQRPVTIAHPEHFVLRWAKNNRPVRVFFINNSNPTGYLLNSGFWLIDLFADCILWSWFTKQSLFFYIYAIAPSSCYTVGNWTFHPSIKVKLTQTKFDDQIEPMKKLWTSKLDYWQQLFIYQVPILTLRHQVTVLSHYSG